MLWRCSIGWQPAHSDPEKELWIEEVTGQHTPTIEKIFLITASTQRAEVAAEAIRDLIRWDRLVHWTVFARTIEKLVGDRSLSVRACAASVILYTANHDWEFAFEQFSRLIEPQGDQTDSDYLLANPYVDHFIYHGTTRSLRGVFETLSKECCGQKFPR